MLGLAATDHRCLAVFAAGDGMDAHPGLLVRGAVFDDALPEKLRAMLERWVGEVSAGSFAEDVSSKGVKAWAVRHEAGVQHHDVLVERLRRIISELASL